MKCYLVLLIILAYDVKLQQATASSTLNIIYMLFSNDYLLFSSSIPFGDAALSMSCSSVKLWKGTVVAGYGTGQIRIYEAVTGILHADINAHARWINSLDIAPFSGLVGCIKSTN